MFKKSILDHIFDRPLDFEKCVVKEINSVHRTCKDLFSYRVAKHLILLEMLVRFSGKGINCATLSVFFNNPCQLVQDLRERKGYNIVSKKDACYSNGCPSTRYYLID